jgi:hypothetical protein
MMKFGITELMIVLFFVITPRIIGFIYCGKKAKELNRDVSIWKFLGVFSPILSMIAIQFLKPVVKYEEQ